MKTKHFFASAAKAAFALAAVFILSFALASCSKDDDGNNNEPEVPAVPANTAVVDGVAMPVTGAEIIKSHLNKGNYHILLILSEDGGKYINIQMSKEHHEGKTIDLTKKEPKHDGWYWYVLYNNLAKIFETFAKPDNDNDLPVFQSGTLYVKRLADTDGKPVFEIVLKNGKVKAEGENGDGKEHTVNINWKGSLKFE